MASQFNPFLFSMEGGGGNGTSIPEQARPPNFVQQYMQGQQLKSVMQERQAMAAERASMAADNAIKAQTMQHAADLQSGSAAFVAGGDTWDKWSKAHPGMNDEVQDTVYTLRAHSLLSRSQAFDGMLKTLPMTQAGLDAYNSPQFQEQAKSLNITLPKYGNVNDFQDGLQTLYDKNHSVLASAQGFGAMVRQWADPNSPLYHNSDLKGRIDDTQTEAKARIQQLQSQSAKEQADAQNAQYGGKSKPTLGGLKGSALALIQNRPNYQGWFKDQNDPKAADVLASQIAGSVQNGYGPKGAYVGMAPQDAVAAEVGRVNFNSPHWYSPYQAQYNPSMGADGTTQTNGAPAQGAGSQPPTAQPPAGANVITAYDKTGKPVKMQLVNGQYQPIPQQ